MSIRNTISQKLFSKFDVRSFYLLVLCFLMSIILSGCGETSAKNYLPEVQSWIDKDTFTWGVSIEENEDSFIRRKVNDYCSWSKEKIVNSGFVFSLIWTLVDYFIVGFIGFLIILSDLFTLRFGGAIGCFFEYWIYDVIRFLAIFGIYI